MIDLPSHELVRLCGQHLTDGELWAEFRERFQGLIYLYLMRAARVRSLDTDADEVPDLAQEVYYRLIRHDGRLLHRFRGTTDFSVMSFLARVSGDVVRDYAQRGMLIPFNLSPDAKANTTQRTELGTERPLRTDHIVMRPKFAEFILRLFISAEHQKHLVGDLAEEYSTQMMPAFGKFWSNIWYLSQAFRTILPIIWRAAYRTVALRWLWEGAGAIFKKLSI